MSQIIYRRLGPQDLELFRSMNVMFAGAFDDQETHLSRKPSDSYMADLLSKDHIIALAAIAREREVVGGIYAFVLEKYEQERSEVYLYDLAVDENYRRQGIARNLIENLKVISKNQGAWVIFVQADRVDQPAIELYRSMGAQEEPLHFDIRV